jgi:hypothetical protein
MHDFYFKSNGKYDVSVDNENLRWVRKGLKNRLSHGPHKEIVIPIDRITEINLSEPKMTTGYIQFVHPDSPENNGTPLEIIKDENTILFTKKEVDQAKELKSLIESLQ